MNLVAFSLALIIGFFFSCDLFLSDKRTSWSFQRSFFTLISTFIPKVYSYLLIPDDLKKEFMEAWLYKFYPALTLVIFLCFLFFYLNFKSLISSLGQEKNLVVLSFWDLIVLGYNKFKEEIEKKRGEIEEIKRKRDDSIVESNKTIGKSLGDFITKIYSVPKGKGFSFESYTCMVLTEFVQKFLSETDARFTIRSFNASTNSMEAFFSTRQDAPPSSIPMDKINNISKSLEEKRPVIYSRNTASHFDTGGSLSKGLFDDYVCFCLSSDKGTKIPSLSVTLDVKGPHATKRLHALVDSGMFEVICNAITGKYIEKEEIGNKNCIMHPKRRRRTKKNEEKENFTCSTNQSSVKGQTEIPFSNPGGPENLGKESGPLDLPGNSREN